MKPHKNPSPPGASGGPSIKDGDLRKQTQPFALLCGPAALDGKAINNLLVLATLCEQGWIIFFYEFILISPWESEKCVWRAFSSPVGGDLTEWQLLSRTSPIT